MAARSVGIRFLFVILFAFLGSHVVTSAKWRQARDVFLSNVDNLSETMKRQPSHMITTRDLFGLTKDEDIKLVDSAPSEQGTNIKKYSETYGGLPVFDASLTVETDAKTDVYTGQVTGKLVQNLDDDINSTIPNLNEQQAMQLAVDYGHFSMEGARIDYNKPQLMIFVKDDVGILVYRIQYYAVSDGKNYRFCMIIDANNETLVKKWNTLETTRNKYKMKGIGGNKLIGKLRYGEVLPYLEVTREGDDCYFGNDIVTVVNLNGEEFLPNEAGNVYNVKCNTGVKDEVNGAYSPINDAVFYGNIVYNMYREWVKVSPVKELPIVLRVHYGQNVVNAFYNGKNFTFGDGNSEYRPLVSLDIIAHEISHCFTEEHSGLIYEGQSGGIDESFSDLAGEAAEKFLGREGTNEWEIGEDVATNPIRNVCNQSTDGMSIIHAGDYNDGMDVHYLSGVFNRFYCLLSRRKGWGTKKVLKTAAHSNRFYWHPSTTFVEAACDFMKSAYDFGYDTKPVERVFRKVGIKVCHLSSYIRTVHQNSKIEGLSAVPEEEIMFKLKIKSQLKNVKIVTFDGMGEADLFVCYKKLGCSEHLTKWRSNKPGTNQKILMESPEKGSYYVILKSKVECFIKDVTLKVTFQENLEDDSRNGNGNYTFDAYQLEAVSNCGLIQLKPPTGVHHFNNYTVQRTGAFASIPIKHPLCEWNYDRRLRLPRSAHIGFNK
ncbi:elastase [Octopus bimaculoides]|uniref:elastase n=1 Tax=Octopus bimaculoides TaxID=37653 RepID=UPI00071C6B09|nr:elastase [Octopus bimaculoides]|eukprot:XP_014783435.1 PREDICTED: elastase-like [Octopus bimaculoides]